MGYARQAIFHRCRDSCMGYCLFRAAENSTRRRTAQFHPTIAEDFQRCWHADHRAAVLLQICHRSRSSGANVPVLKKFLQRIAIGRCCAPGKDTSVW